MLNSSNNPQSVPVTPPPVVPGPVSAEPQSKTDQWNGFGAATPATDSQLNQNARPSQNDAGNGQNNIVQNPGLDNFSPVVSPQLKENTLSSQNPAGIDRDSVNTQWTELSFNHRTPGTELNLNSNQVGASSAAETPNTSEVPVSKKSEYRPAILAFLDGIARSTSVSFQQLAGSALESVRGSLLSTFVVEAVRTGIGIFRGGIAEGMPSKAQLGLMSVWSANAVTMTVGHLYAYSLNADQGVANLIVMGSIVPGMVVDWCMFKDKPTSSKVLASSLFLGGCYVALGAPGILSTASIGAWVGIKAVIATQLAVNEGVRRQMALLRDEKPDIHKFTSAQAMVWVGGISMLGLAPAVIATGGLSNLANLPTSFWVGTLGIAATVIASTALSLAVYTGGQSSILKRKIITAATSVVATMGAGALLFSEALTPHKLIGAGMILVASSYLALKDRKK